MCGEWCGAMELYVPRPTATDLCPPLSGNLYHVNVNHQIGFKDCLIRFNDFVFFCVSYVR